MRSGSLVPDEMILRLILQELESRGWLFPSSSPQTSGPSGSVAAAASAIDPSSSSLAQAQPQPSADPTASFILDGFPRTATQAEALAALVPINLCVSLKTPAHIILARIAGRLVHAPSGRVYNSTFNPPRTPGRDDLTGEPLVRRGDDDEGVWRDRLRKFDDTSRGLLDFYRDKGVLWEVEGKSSDEISPLLFREFERRFVD
jgi:adenylate kinase